MFGAVWPATRGDPPSATVIGRDMPTSPTMPRWQIEGSYELPGATDYWTNVPSGAQHLRNWTWALASTKAAGRAPPTDLPRTSDSHERGMGPATSW
jgi:hypothetical protein